MHSGSGVMVVAEHMGRVAPAHNGQCRTWAQVYSSQSSSLINNVTLILPTQYLNVVLYIPFS